MKRTWTDEQLIEAVKSSKSKSEVCRKLGLSLGGTYRMFDNHFTRLNIDTSHFLTGKDLMKYIRSTIQSRSLEDLGKDRRYFYSRNIKNKILKEKALEYTCSICGIYEWREQKLSLHLDHINGDRLDNGIENLRFLCPNCHSLTSTYCGKNIKRRRVPTVCKDCGKTISCKSLRCKKCFNSKNKHPTKIDWSQFDIISMVEVSNYSDVARKLNVSSRTIKKHYMRLKSIVGLIGNDPMTLALKEPCSAS